MINVKSVFNIVQKKISIMTKILVLFHYSIPRNSLFVFLMIIPKYIPLLMFTSNLDLNQIPFNDSRLLFKKFLLNFTLFKYFENFELKTYLIISILILLVEIIFISYIIKYLYYFKNHKKNIQLELYPKIMFYVNSIFSQFFCEYLSFIYAILLRKNINLNSPIFANNKFPILKVNKINIFIQIILSIFHTLGIIFLLFFTFYACIVVNSVFKTTLITLNLKHRQIFYNFVILTFFSTFHYYEVLFNESGSKIFKITSTIIIFSYLIIDILIWHFCFEKENQLTYICRFLNEYNLISIIFQIYIAIQSIKNVKKWEVFSITILNMIITYLLLSTLIFLREYHFYKKAQYYLFNELEISNLNDTLESFIFILDKIFTIQTNEKGIIDLVNLIKKHMKKCINDNCKCKIIDFTPEWNKMNEEYSIKFLQGIGFLMDSTIYGAEIFKTFRFILFLVEYFSHTRENVVYSLSVCLTNLSSNNERFNYIDYFELYNLTLHYIELLNEQYKENNNRIQFQCLFDNIQERVFFKKNINKYCNIINNIIDSKIKYENSLKFELYDKQTEFLDINSVYINRNNFLLILNELKELNNISNDVHHNLIKHSQTKKESDFHYIIFLFYYIFCEKIPDKILDSFNTLLNGESFKNMSFIEMNRKFDSIINHFLSLIEEHKYMIIACSDGIKIKYISSNLCNQLGFNSSKIKNQDFNNLFPKELKEPHTKAMLNYITIHQNLFIKKNTYIFDINENAIKIFLQCCVLPILSKHLYIIIQINHIESNKFYFLLDQDLHEISISKAMENNYHINLELLRKSDTELIDLFLIHKKNIEKNFKNSLKKIKVINQNLKNDALEFYNSLLFGLNNSLYEKFNQESKYKLIKNAFKFIFKSNSNNINDIINKKEIYITKISKISFFQNIIYSLNKLNDISSKEEKIKSLIDSIIKINSDFSQTNIIKESLNKKSSKEILQIDEEEEQIFLELYCQIKLLYNRPIYIIKIIEKQCFESKEFFTPNIHQMINKKSISYAKSTKSSFFSPHQLSCNSQLLNHESSKKTKILKINSFQNVNIGNVKSMKSINNVVSLQLNQKNDKDNENQQIKLIDLFQDKKKNKKLYKILIIIEIILVFLSIIITICLFFLKNNYMKNVEIINDFFARITFLRDKLTYFYSNILSDTFEYMNFTNMNLTYKDFINQKIEILYALNNAKKKFWDGITYYDKYINGNRINLLSVYIKNSKNWEIKEEKGDFFPELSYLLYLIAKSLNEKNKEGLIEDLNNFFQMNYKKNYSTIINSSFMKAFYFLYNNYDKNFMTLITGLKIDVRNDLINYLKKGQWKIFIFDIFWVALDFFIFLGAFLIFHYFNKNIFQIILSLFYNDNKCKISKNSEKNKYENFYMKKKIKLYLELIDNINYETKNAFKIFQNDINNTIQRSSITLFNTQFFLKQDNQQSILNYNNNMNNSTNNNLLNNSNINNSNSNLLNNSFLIEDLNIRKIKSPKSKKKKNHNKENNNNNSNNTNKKNPKKEILISPETLVSFLMKKNVILSKVTFIFFIILFIISSIIGYFHFYSSIYYETKIRHIHHIFLAFIDYFFEISNVLNCIRISIFLGQPFNDFINFINLQYTELQNNFNKEVASSYFKEFKNIYYFYEQIKLPINSTEINLNFLCNDNKICIQYLQKQNSYCSGSIFLCHQILCQKYISVINDIKNLKLQFTIKELKDFTIRSDFSSLQQYSDFVFNYVQYKFYIVVVIDFDEFKASLHKLMTTLNIILFGFQFFLFFIFFLILGLYIYNTMKYALHGKKIFKTAFFKDSSYFLLNYNNNNDL